MKNLTTITTYITETIRQHIAGAKRALVWMLFGVFISLITSVYMQSDLFVETIRQQYHYFIKKTVETTQSPDAINKKEEVEALISKEQENQRIGEYVMFVMNFSKVKMSDFQKQLMAQAIVRVSGQVFETEEERHWGVVLVNNESGFDRMAKSSAGAIGLTQVMSAFVDEFGGHCGIKGIEKNEINDTETNLLLGFCRFKYLLKCYNGVYSTALAAYNGGKNAKSVKEIQSLSKITTTETLQYIAKFTHVVATANANKQIDHSKTFRVNTKIQLITEEDYDIK